MSCCHYVLLITCSMLGSDMSLLHRYTFGKPVTGKLTVNMTVNGVGYYRHEMGQPVIKTMEVSSVIICLLMFYQAIFDIYLQKNNFFYHFIFIISLFFIFCLIRKINK